MPYPVARLLLLLSLLTALAPPAQATPPVAPAPLELETEDCSALAVDAERRECEEGDQGAFRCRDSGTGVNACEEEERSYGEQAGADPSVAWRAAILVDPREESNGEAGEEYWPDFAVALVDGHGEAFCTGSFVHPQIVVTAAHCTNVPWVKEFRIVIGRNFRNPDRTLGVSKVIPHPEYDRDTSDADIALVIVDEPAPPHIRVLPLGFPSEAPSRRASSSLVSAIVGSEVPKTSLVVVLGYGAQRGNQRRLNGYLHFSPIKFPRNPPGPQILAQEDLYASCPGDSGGPAIMPSKIRNSTTYHLVGVNSYFVVGRALEELSERQRRQYRQNREAFLAQNPWFDDCRRGQLGAYTNVGFFRNWITSVARGQGFELD